MCVLCVCEVGYWTRKVLGLRKVQLAGPTLPLLCVSGSYYREPCFCLGIRARVCKVGYCLRNIEG